MDHQRNAAFMENVSLPEEWNYNWETSVAEYKAVLKWVKLSFHFHKDM